MSDQDPGAPNNPEWPNPQDGATTPAGGQPQGQSRRAFLRASVIASAAVVAAGAAVVAESPLGPKFLSTIGVAHAANSNPATCITIIEAWHFDLTNHNNALIIDGTAATDPGPADFPVNTCFTLTSSSNGISQVMYGTVTSAGQHKEGTKTHWQVMFDQSAVKFFTSAAGGGTCQAAPNGTYPSGSFLCQAPCTLTCS